MLPVGDCIISEAVCCPNVFDIAEHILTNVYNDLLGCYDQSPCMAAPLAYVTMGEGDDAVPDALCVSLADLRPSPQTQASGRMAPAGMMMASYRVDLRESGWPMVTEENGTLYVPDPALQNAVARHAFAHGERMYRTLTYMAAAGTMAPDSIPGCSRGTVGPLLPRRPDGGMVGWFTVVTIGIPW